MRLLLVEDDTMIGETVLDLLRAEHYAVDWVKDGEMADTVLSRPQIEEKLYGWKDGVSSNAVEVYIHGVRKKLGDDLIQNVRGVGYMVPKGAG